MCHENLVGGREGKEERIKKLVRKSKISLIKWSIGHLGPNDQ